jgi:hypothetical protein
MFQFPIFLVLQLVVDEKKLIVTNEVGLALPKSVVLQVTHFKQRRALEMPRFAQVPDTFPAFLC